MLCLSAAQLLIVTITTLKTPSTQTPHFSGNERQAEIDLRQVQRGMVVQLQEEGLPLCWQCEFCQYFANIKSIIKVIPVIQVAKYNKLYLCGSSMPSDFKLTSKVKWIIQNTIFFLTTFPGKNYDFEVQVKQVCGQTRIQSHSHRYGWQ